jgi:hypothetical protein
MYLTEIYTYPSKMRGRYALFNVVSWRGISPGEPPRRSSGLWKLQRLEEGYFLRVA